MRDGAIHANGEKYFELAEANNGLEQEIESLQRQLARSRDMLEQTKAELSGVLESLPFFTPKPVMEEMLAGDFGRAKGIFESAARIDLNQFPIDAMPERRLKKWT